MTPQFRAEYANRGREFKLGDRTAEEMDTEDLYALIGFLSELSQDKDPEIQILQFEPLGAPKGVERELASPPKNNGLLEG